MTNNSANNVIEVEGLSKVYRLGYTGTGSLRDDLRGWWALLRGKPNPNALIAESNDRTDTKSKGYVYALKDINLSVQRGEVLGIIGKNGAGKSTLLKLLTRVTGPTTGTIRMQGRVGSLLEVGTGFNPELSGRENIYLNGSILGMRRQEIDDKFDDIVEFAGVAKYIDTPVKRYSSGMRVRLGFAVAAFLEPEILIIDEVLAVGDAEFQKKAIGKMQESSGKGQRTVLFVSHNLDSVKTLCTRCILVDKGNIIADGNVEEVISRYRDISTSMDIGTPESIRQRTKGKVAGGIRFKSIKLLNDNGEETTFFHQGENVTFQIDTEKETDIQELFTAIVLYAGESKVPLASTEKIQLDHQAVSNKHRFKIKIKDLQLKPGTYPVYFWLGRTYPSIVTYDALNYETSPIRLNIRTKGELYKKNSAYIDLFAEVVE